ncbi:MAG: DEAD/DEAH box helicase [Bacteroidales bacterium]
MMTFEDFQLHPSLLKSLVENKFNSPTPVQAQTLPPALAGKDILGIAQTGTGKTAAYLVPVIQRLYSHKEEGMCEKALILVPTRELVQQVGEMFDKITGDTKLRMQLIYGGVPVEEQIEALASDPDVLIATPGRLLDLLRRKAFSLDSVHFFILDEADRMLDLGFAEDLKTIVSGLPSQRQSMLFSATMLPDVAALAQNLLSEPETISVVPESMDTSLIQQKVYYIEKQNKANLLIDFLRKPEVKSAIVFTKTRKGADMLHIALQDVGIESDRLHSDRSQHARDTILQAVRDQKLPVLIATDIAARGIDVAHLTHVFNFELPQAAETYIHRIGRTGRAGKDGVAISFCEPEEKAMLGEIQKLMKQTIPVVENHTYATLSLKKALLGADEKIAGKAAKKKSYMGSKANGDYFRRQKMAKKKQK